MNKHTQLLLFAPFLVLLLVNCGGSSSGDGGGGSTSGVTITESGGTTAVTEGGPKDTYDLVLISQPSADVTITVTPDGQTDLGSGPGMAIALLFTPANWSVPKVVFVAAVDDSDVEGSPHHSTIRHTVSSGDIDYHGYAIIDVIVSITDNDPGSGTGCSDADVTIDIPFDYTLTSDHLAINTPGGVLKTHIGPWGAHTGPHTGHEDGEIGQDSTRPATMS
jgi:hypothetical protein